MSDTRTQRRQRLSCPSLPPLPSPRLSLSSSLPSSYFAGLDDLWYNVYSVGTPEIHFDILTVILRKTGNATTSSGSVSATSGNSSAPASPDESCGLLTSPLPPGWYVPTMSVFRMISSPPFCRVCEEILTLGPTRRIQQSRDGRVVGKYIGDFALQTQLTELSSKYLLVPEGRTLPLALRTTHDQLKVDFATLTYPRPSYSLPPPHSKPNPDKPSPAERHG